uniref:Uncharacterized protein n=1 Tax=Buteo japonicus TaxID=224669 RepID=A0A8C0AXX3_9AVES
MPCSWGEEGFFSPEADWHWSPEVFCPPLQHSQGSFVPFWLGVCCSCSMTVCQRLKELASQTLWWGCTAPCSDRLSGAVVKEQSYLQGGRSYSPKDPQAHQPISQRFWKHKLRVAPN